MSLPPVISELIERFERNREAYRSGQYNETQVRLEFINPFFKALGWDIDNEQGYAEAYKDVIHEDAIKIGGATKAPDYCFRIGGTRKFFLEAKKPSVNIKEDIKLIIEIKSVEALNPVHLAQILTYLKLSNCKLGLLINFNVLLLKDGIKRVIN